MSFTEAVRTCLTRKYATVEGRAARPEFWWFALFQFIVLGVASAISDVLAGFAVLALLLPAVGAGGRRLHDTGKSAWLLLIGFIPLVGHLILLYFFVQPSAGPNEYGGGFDLADAPTVMPGSGQP